MYKHYTFLTWTQDDNKRSDSFQAVILLEQKTACIPHSHSGRVAEGKIPYSCYKSNQGFLLLQPVV
jgi:hypothetical protein